MYSLLIRNIIETANSGCIQRINKIGLAGSLVMNMIKLNPQ